MLVNKRILSLFCCLVIMLSCISLGNPAHAADNTASDGFFNEKELFNVNDGKGYVQYRIPSISVTANGTILAVAEARTGGDQTPTDLVLRRSTDGGETFSEQVILAPGVSNGNAEMNPMLLTEDTGSTVHLLWSRWEWGNCEYFIRTSTDNGATWGKTRNITSVLDAYTDPDSPKYFPNLAGAGMGPGHGFQMTNGALVVPIYLTTDGWAKSTVSYIYSKDGGKTWKAGPKVPNPGGYSKIHENMMVELSNGGLMTNMRNPGSNYRAVSVTSGLNEPWSMPVSDKKLIDPVNEASLARYDDDTILFTNTANKTYRTNMTIRMSDDDGKTWFASKEIYAGQTGYSDVYVGPDKTIYMLYEKPAGSKIVFAQFNKDWILGSSNLRLHASEQIKPGESTTVNASFTNHSEMAEKDIDVKLELPENWKAEKLQPTTFDEVKPGESVEVSWKVTPKETVKAGTYELAATASFTLDGNQKSTTTTKKIQLLPVTPTKTSYLSDLGWVSAMNGWGPVERDTSVGGNGADDGEALTINGKTYEKGLGVHAYSKIVYHIGGNFSKFTAEVGVDDEVTPSSAASVNFQVWGDGEKLFDSGVMTGEDSAKKVDVNLEGVNELQLVVTDAGNGNGSDHADWANAKIINDKEDLSASFMRELVEKFEDEGEFANDRTAHSMKVHLTALARYESNGLTEKVLKHLAGFEQLLKYQKENDLISERAYRKLKTYTGDLVEKYL